MQAHISNLLISSASVIERISVKNDAALSVSIHPGIKVSFMFSLEMNAKLIAPVCSRKFSNYEGMSILIVESRYEVTSFCMKNDS